MLIIADLGKTHFADVFKLQKTLVSKRRSGIILLTEHYPVITTGIRKDKNILLKDAEVLEKSGIELFAANRGGGATCHNVGQLVVYPVIELSRHQFGIRDYISALEKIGRKLFYSFGLKTSKRMGYPGLWKMEKKIASIGVRINSGLAYHGIALNLCNDLDIFNNIIPCGLEGVEVTSLEKEISGSVDFNEAKRRAAEILGQTFNEEYKCTQKTVSELAEDENISLQQLLQN
ncbi:Octanoyltransferase [Sedimentisphaera cyanobacteriorum]|uniref:Octanoyltransferase n=1 Tax=Sedimentisphaera cyanobacteriorum TaxID=1940790 RepID=A0A1Q2HMZ8_9BACT|nr:lipoyl(octanoyl) transferase LipB [Sedimentisphaera cyanobacteriorum]AQQ08822.1 Octanoyltransferase [Sedimentisphaera cyanobacteriorum]